MDTTRIPPDELVAHAGFVRSLAYHLLRHDADADDATQETLARAIARPPGREGPVRPWLSGVLRNVVRRGARDSVRRNRREAEVAAPERSPSAAEFAAREQILRTVGAAVLALDEPQRVVVLLRHYEGLPPRKIATRLGVPVETVKSRLKRAHERLREALDEGRRGNVEGWRSSLALLVGFEPGRGPGPTDATTLGGIAVTTKTVGIVAGALVAACIGFVVVWKASTRPGATPAVVASAPDHATGPASDARPPELAPSPRASSIAPGKAAPASDENPAAAPVSGPAAGWKRWTVGSIRIDVPEAWESQGHPAATDMRSWSTAERPFPHATFRLHRSVSSHDEGLLADSIVSPAERVQIANQTATLRILEPKSGPQRLALKGLVVKLDRPFGDGRELEFLAISTKDQFAGLESTYRAILASVQLIASDATTGNETPSAGALRAYQGETAADTFEGVVLLGDLPFPGGEARVGTASKRRTAAIGADGRFRFERIEAGELARVEVTPAGMSPRELFLAPTPTGARRRVILVVGRSIIEGRVFDRDGRAVVGAAVRVMWRGPRLSASYADNIVVATTDADGRYRADHLLPGRYELHTLIGKSDPRQRLVEVVGITPAPCDLGSPTPEPVLSGVVRRIGGTVPGPGYLMFSSTDAKSMESTSYDAEGAYSVRLPAGTYLVRVQFPVPTRSVLLDAPVVVAPGVSTKDLTLPSGRVRGRVIDSATRLPRPREQGPRSAWQLCLQLVGGVAFQTDLCTNIADDGTFQFEYMAPGTYTVVSMAPLAPGADGKPRVIEVLDGGVETRVELELKPK